MKKKILLFFLLIAFVLPFFNVGAITLTSGTGKSGDNKERPEYVPGEVLVRYKDSFIDLSGRDSSFSVQSFASNMGVSKKQDIAAGNISVFKINDGKSVEEKIIEMSKDRRVEYVEPNYLYYPVSIPTNDTYRNLLWGLSNTGQIVNGTSGAVGADISIIDAWSINEGDNESIIVAVIDDGVAYTHLDLVNNMWDGSDCLDEEGVYLGGCIHGYDYYDDDKDPFPVGTHGTHVAGTIGAEKNNERGVVGVSPNIEIMALKVADDDGLPHSAIISAIHFARENGAKVINASFGAGSFSASMRDAIADFGSAGGLFIAAAGNDTNNNDINVVYPASYDLDNIIAVAATNQSDGLAWFSNYGATKVHVGAPGTNIYSTVPQVVTTEHEVGFEDFDDLIFPAGWVVDGDEDNWSLKYYDPVWGGVMVADYSNEYNSYRGGSNTSVTSAAYDLSAEGTYDIGFWLACQMENSYLVLEFSGDGGLNFTEIWRLDSNYLSIFEGYVGGTINESYYTSDFKLRFRWVTSEQKNLMGCVVDDVEILRLTTETTANNDYGFKNGTSMATPHVSGLTALVWGYNPSLSYAEVKNIILNSVDELLSLTGKVSTGGRINAHRTLQNTPYTVAFNEQTELEEVAIEIRETNESGDVVGTITTDNKGEAIINLLNGDYWYQATLPGHVTKIDTFTVSDAGVTINFTLLVITYTVKFAEMGGVEGVSIQIYDSSLKEEEHKVGEPIFTAVPTSPAYAEISLPDGEYWFTASKTHYVDSVGSFTVNGASPADIELIMSASSEVFVDSFEDLQWATDQSGISTINVTNDIIFDGDISLKEGVTLDFGGKIVNGTGGINITNNNVTVRNGYLRQELGMPLVGTVVDSTVIYVSMGGGVTIDNIDIDYSRSNKVAGVLVEVTYQATLIKDSVIKVSGEELATGIVTNAISDPGMPLSVTGTTFVGDRGVTMMSGSKKGTIENNIFNNTEAGLWAATSSEIPGDDILGLLKDNFFGDSLEDGHYIFVDGNGYPQPETVDDAEGIVDVFEGTKHITINFDEGVEDPEVDFGATSGGSKDVPQTTINSNNIKVEIPTTTVSGTGWDGVIKAPRVTTVDLPVEPGKQRTLETAIEVGFSGAKISFERPVKLTIPNQAGKKVGYTRDGEGFTEITTVCGENSRAWATDNLGVDENCKVDEGLDLVIWTRHFTKFYAYTETTTPPPSGGGGGGGGGGGSTPPPATQTPEATVVTTDSEEALLSSLTDAEVLTKKAALNAQRNRLQIMSSRVNSLISTLRRVEGAEELLKMMEDFYSEINQKLNQLNAELAVIEKRARIIEHRKRVSRMIGMLKGVAGSEQMIMLLEEALIELGRIESSI